MQTMTEVDRFIEGFRGEHRAARDLLIGMIEAFRARDGVRFGELMADMNVKVGPHMRYEEEVMYPSLVSFFGEEYIEHMIEDHDRMLGAAARLSELAGHDPVTDEDAEEAERLIRMLLPHVSDCDGLAIIIETLPEPDQHAIAQARDRAIAEGLTVMQWAELRGRTPIAPS